METVNWRDVYDLWFPPELRLGKLAFQTRIGTWWMQGGATPELPPFAHYVDAASAGELQHWAETAEGRLALIVVLDQFPRGLFAGTWRAYANDQTALRLCEEGLANGHYDQLQFPWETFFFTLPLLHAEGPDHLDRLRRLLGLAEKGIPEAIRAFPELRPIFDFSLSQLRANFQVIARFGRFPHRNAMHGRPSTPEEMEYIDKGDFVHLRKLPMPAENPAIPLIKGAT